MVGGGRTAEVPPPLVLERSIALKGVTGQIDHLAVDLARKRLFVAELGNGTVDVIDLASGTVIRRLEGLKEPQGLGYAPAADILAIKCPLFPDQSGKRFAHSGTVRFGLRAGLWHRFRTLRTALNWIRPVLDEPDTMQISELSGNLA